MPVVVSANIFRNPEQEDCNQNQADAGVARGDDDSQGGDHRGAHQIDGDDEFSPIEPIGQRPGVQAEEQPRQLLQKWGEGDQTRVAGERCDE